MIALTQEKREELTNYAIERLASHVIHGGCSDEESILKIALASLTAEPVAVLYRTGETLTKKECGDDKVFSICCKVETALYLAPPVPDIKFPPFMRVKEFEQPVARQMIVELRAVTWAACIAETKRLNGLGE